MAQQRDKDIQAYICPITKIQCDDECCVSAENCHLKTSIGYISEDCEAVKNWDSFVEQKNNELEIEKLAEEVYGKGVNQDYEEGFVDGYNKAKETLYTKDQVMEVIELARLIDYNGSNDYYMSDDEIIQALKP
jgi:hypothetical protein